MPVRVKKMRKINKLRLVPIQSERGSEAGQSGEGV
jgi:hypothetical protein